MSLAYPPIAEQACKNCRFCINLECRRHAPVPQLGQTGTFLDAYWPEVDPTDWCGEWAPREAQP